MIIILNLKYENKLLENTAGDGANGILTEETVAVSLKYLSNFWTLLEMPLINCKVELKLKWTKYSVFSAARADNGNVNNDDNNIFTIKDKKLYALVVTLSARDNLKDQFIVMIIKQRLRIKIPQMCLDIFSKQTLLESIDYLFQFI